MKELPHKQKLKRKANGFRCQGCNKFIGTLATPEKGQAVQETEENTYYRVKSEDSNGDMIFYFLCESCTGDLEQ